MKLCRLSCWTEDGDFTARSAGTDAHIWLGIDTQKPASASGCSFSLKETPCQKYGGELFSE